jgi:hypothetical protein
MSWRVEHKPEGPEDKRPYKILKADSGEVVGSSKTEQAAKGSVAARYVSERAAPKTEGGEKNG